MSSDTIDETTYERFVKLLQSLFQLVTTKKRHLATVCATLQKTIFETRGWPESKKWSAICELGRRDNLLMMVVASVNLAERNDVTERIVSAFPECFTDDSEESVVYPLSYIREIGAREAKAAGIASLSSGRRNPESHGAVKKLGIPHWSYAITEKAEQEWGDPILPDSIPRDAEQGALVEVDGRKFVVIEANRGGGMDLMALIPAEMVDVNS